MPDPGAQNALAREAIRGSLENVRTWLTWLLALGVIAGLSGRVMALDHVHSHDAAHCCDVGDHGDHNVPVDPPDDGHPAGHHDHHHHTCCHPAPLGTMEIPSERFFHPLGAYVKMAWTVLLPPGEPVFALDKPPLN